MKHTTSICRWLARCAAACTLPVLLAGSLGVLAEGSKDLTENGGYRPYTERYGMETAGEQRDQVVCVYLQAGETVYFGSSVWGAELGFTNAHMGTSLPDEELAALNNTDILVMTPAWSATANSHAYPYINGVRDAGVLLFDTAANATTGTQGYIATPAEERAGPSLGAATNGYTPYSITATAETAGIYRFKFYSQEHDTENPGTVGVDAPWNQKGGCIAAWDTTVVGADGNVVEGRTFTDTLFLNMGSNLNRTGVLMATMYAVTDDGYQYKVDFNGMDPFGFVFFANNRGLLKNGATPTSLYHSVKSDNNQLSDLQSHGVLLNNLPTNTALDHTYNLFFNAPDAAALAALSIPQTVATGSEGISNFAFTGLGSTAANTGYAGLGGVFSFDAAADINAGSFQIELNFGEGNIVYLANTLQKGVVNTIPWDGLDATGNPVPAGSYNTGTVTMKVKGGEIHFPLMDVENNYGGIKITRLNGTGAPDTTVYYNNAGASNIGDTTAPWTAAKNWNVADAVNATAGVTSADGAMAYQNRAGDQTALDVWAYYNQPVDLQSYTFTLLDTTFTVTKEWAGTTPHPTSVQVTLLDESDTPVGSAVTLNGNPGWTYTWVSLNPLHNYHVQETALPDCTVTYGTVAGTVESGYTQIITNTYTGQPVTPAPGPSSTPEAPASSTPPAGTAVQTGDTSAPWLWATVALCAAVGLVVAGALLWRRKKP